MRLRVRGCARVWLCACGCACVHACGRSFADLIECADANSGVRRRPRQAHAHRLHNIVDRSGGPQRHCMLTTGDVTSRVSTRALWRTSTADAMVFAVNIAEHVPDPGRQCVSALCSCIAMAFKAYSRTLKEYGQ